MKYDVEQLHVEVFEAAFGLWKRLEIRRGTAETTCRTERSIAVETPWNEAWNSIRIQSVSALAIQGKTGYINARFSQEKRTANVRKI